MGHCGYDSINTSRGKQYTSKAAETRASNTRREVLFIASGYYDCAQFVFNSGFRDIGIVNNQFDTMMNTYVSTGKVKRESYKKFQEVALGIDITSFNNKDIYINAIKNAIDASMVYGSKVSSSKLFKDFQGLLSKYGLSLGDKKEQLIFLDLLNDLADASNSSTLAEMLDDKKVEWGLRSVNFTEPRVRTSNGDGCGHGITYGSALRNWDKV